MPIKQTANGGYEISFCVQRRRIHRRLPPGTSSNDAKRYEAELRASVARDRAPVIPGDPRLTEVMTLYMQHAKTLRSTDTAEFHALRIGKWVEQYRASETRQAVAHIIADMQPVYAAATINRSLGALKKALKLAWERGHTPVNYGDQVKRLPENNQRTFYLSMKEVKAIADHASEQVRCAIWVALLTGCRRGEVLKIERADIGRNTIRILAGNTKTLRYREVPIVPALRPWLKSLPLDMNFEGLKTGFRRAREAAGMEEINFHDLRHSCATILLGLKVPLHVVRDILGHTSIKTTERYAHAMVAPQREALEKLGNMHQRLHQPGKPSRKRSVSA